MASYSLENPCALRIWTPDGARHVVPLSIKFRRKSGEPGEWSLVAFDYAIGKETVIPFGEIMKLEDGNA